MPRKGIQTKIEIKTVTAVRRPVKVWIDFDRGGKERVMYQMEVYENDVQVPGRGETIILEEGDPNAEVILEGCYNVIESLENFKYETAKAKAEELRTDEEKELAKYEKVNK